MVDVALYMFDDVMLTVHGASSASGQALSELLRDLSFRRATVSAGRHIELELEVRVGDTPPPLPAGGRQLFATAALQAIETGDHVFVVAGSSLLCIDAIRGRATARLASAFATQPRLTQQRFWTFGLMKLLRTHGIYGLHAAGVSSPGGLNILAVGPSGSGKSTLALGLLRRGWRYLSDDALLLRGHAEGIEALAFRRPFSIDAAHAAEYSDLPIGPVHHAIAGTHKRRVDVQTTYPALHMTRCRPDVLVFPRIASQSRSVVRPLAPAAAIGRLLAQSGPELFDAATMPRHLGLLSRLAGQARAYELCAGHELRWQPDLLLALLDDAGGIQDGANHCRAHEPV